MHTLLSASSILFILLGSLLAFSMLHHLHSWSLRRSIQLFILLMPLVIIGIGVDGIHHLAVRLCPTPTPLWDTLFGVFLPLSLGSIALGAFGLGIARLVLMKRVVARRHYQMHPELQHTIDGLTERLQLRPVRLLLYPYKRPLAFTCGVLRSKVLLSTWMIEHLERDELEAVLTHELEHVARRDFLFIWLATILRDAFFYLPTSRRAYRQLQQEKEFACDDLVVGVTRQPLALASALTKVWLHTLEGPGIAHSNGLQPLTSTEELTKGRIEKLLDSSTAASHSKVVPHHAATSSLTMLTLTSLFMIQGINILIMVALMGCSPLALLTKWL